MLKQCSTSYFLIEAFSCQVWSFSVLLGRVQVVPGGLQLRPRRSLEVRRSPELQNGGLRALEEAWDDFLLEAFSCQVCSFSVLLGRFKLVPEGVELRPWRSLEVRGSVELTRRALLQHNASRVIRKRENDDLYLNGLFRYLG